MSIKQIFDDFNKEITQNLSDLKEHIVLFKEAVENYNTITRKVIDGWKN